MNNNPQIAVIFDMDGVIVDSNPLITATWRTFFESHQITLTDEQLNHYVFGRMGRETLQLVFNRPLNEEELHAYLQEVGAGVLEKYRAHGPIVAGFKTFVESLLAAGIKVAIATSSPMENVKVVLEMAAVIPYFTLITDASQVQNSKPHPEVYLKTAERLGVDVNNCIVFEDSFSGIQSAKSAGMRVIGVTTTHSEAELGPLTDLTVADFANISANHIKELAQAVSC